MTARSSVKKTEPKWWERNIAQDFTDEDLLVDWLFQLARSPFEQNPTKQIAFIQAARRIQELEQRLYQLEVEIGKVPEPQ